MSSNNKIIKNRKAMSAAVIVTLILGLLILVGYLYFNYSLVKVSDESKIKRECKEALRIGSATKVKGADFLQTITGGQDRQTSDVPCKVINKEITGTEDAAKAELANAMYNSWDMMHKGELDMFSGKSGEKTYCILTHHITFKGTPKINSFSTYLTANSVPDPIEKKTYAEYLKCFNTDPSIFKTTLQPSEDTIDTSKDYGIMFVYAKKGYLHKIWSGAKGATFGLTLFTLGTLMLGGPAVPAVIALGGIATGTAAGGALGYAAGGDKAADWEACVVLFPYSTETLKNFNCTYMPGVQGAR
jgi:hypothetical protein